RTTLAYHPGQSSCISKNAAADASKQVGGDLWINLTKKLDGACPVSIKNEPPEGGSSCRS
ncbi:MAG: hypothetical protein KGJ29_15390, partial [Hyphomicrobiales bacterium]|nr:hypothetical protein [Hyphomicrobiales bacterium]